MDYRTKNLPETGEIMGPEVDRKRQKIESSREEHMKAIESRPEKMGPENTEDSDRAKFKALLRQARESGALDYSCFPPDWLEFGHFPMLACEGSEHYHFSLKMATFALDRINNEDGKTFELVCVDKIAIISFDQYIIQFTVRQVVANDDASLEIIQARVQFPGPDCRDAIVSMWAWYHPSQGV